jgi:hypothetical protein
LLPGLSLSGKQRTCSVSGEGVTLHIFHIFFWFYANMATPNGSISPEEFQEMRTQVNQLT